MKPAEMSVDEAFELLESNSAVFVDVRDAGSWRAAHIPGALHVGDHNVRSFIAETEKDKTTIVYCYHGHSSLGGAAFLESEGFTKVYSMAGGFAAWHSRPVEKAPLKPPTAAQARPPTEGSPQPEQKGSRRGKLLRRLRSMGRSVWPTRK